MLAEPQLEQSVSRGIDSWNLVKDYLQGEGIMAVTDNNHDEDEMSYHDSSYDEEEDYLSDEYEEDFEDEMEDEEEEEEEENIPTTKSKRRSKMYLNNINNPPNQTSLPTHSPTLPSPSSNPPPPPSPSPSPSPNQPLLPSSHLNPSTNPSTNPSNKLNHPPSPPINLPHPRKRLFLETQDPLPLPLPTTTIPNPIPGAIPVEQSEQPSKRRRIEDEGTGPQGWLGVAKTAGKYTVAGVVGGAATFLGLLWSAQQ